jgi:hypothetical protein
MEASIPLDGGGTGWDDRAADGEIPTGWFVEYDEIEEGKNIRVYAICTPDFP